MEPQADEPGFGIAGKRSIGLYLYCASSTTEDGDDLHPQPQPTTAEAEEVAVAVGRSVSAYNPALVSEEEDEYGYVEVVPRREGGHASDVYTLLLDGENPTCGTSSLPDAAFRRSPSSAAPLSSSAGGEPASGYDAGLGPPLPTDESDEREAPALSLTDSLKRIAESDPAEDEADEGGPRVAVENAGLRAARGTASDPSSIDSNERFQTWMASKDSLQKYILLSRHARDFVHAASTFGESARTPPLNQLILLSYKVASSSSSVICPLKRSL